jgi:hypothetical protein
MIFGDATPEDAWHPDDPLAVLVDNVSRRLALLGEPRRLRDDAPLGELVAELDDRLAAFRTRAGRDYVTDADRLRADLIAEDLDHVRGRVG